MDPDVFDKALEKLWIHGGAVLDYAENASAGAEAVARILHRPGRTKAGADRPDDPLCRDEPVPHVDAGAPLRRSCRMVRRLRDLRFLRAGGLRGAAVPHRHRGRSGRRCSSVERHCARASRDRRASCTRELYPGGEMSRDTFEDVLGAMARAGLARLADAVFEKDGRQIPYRTVRLTPAGRAADETTPIDLVMKTPPRRRQTRSARRKLPPVVSRHGAHPKRTSRPRLTGGDAGSEAAAGRCG